MRILFIHQNMPGQFGRLAHWLASNPGNQVVFITRKKGVELRNVHRVTYEINLPARTGQMGYGHSFEEQCAYGAAVVRSAQALLEQGFSPDVIVGHPGWGEMLFIKDVFPDVPMVNYCEYYFDPQAPYFGGDPPKPLSLSKTMHRRAQSAHLLLSLEAADQGWSPTRWQKSLHPECLQEKIAVCFDGVDTQLASPDPTAVFQLPTGGLLSSDNLVITYVARGLEPTRGFPQFCRAIPEILRRLPNAHVVIAGSEQAHYDSAPAAGGTWKEKMLRDVPIDLERVHFLGRLQYSTYTKLLQISSVHVYLTTPTVLSWSLFEAMSAGCLLVASDTEPVREVIEDAVNGFLAPFDSASELAERVQHALLCEARAEVRVRAREAILANYAAEDCIAKQIEMLNRLIQKRDLRMRGAAGEEKFGQS